MAGEPPNRLHPSRRGHADVHQDDVGPVRSAALTACSPLGLRDHLDLPGRLQHGFEARAHQRLVVGDQDTNHGEASPCGLVSLGVFARGAKLPGGLGLAW